jgi:hypothetical protein
MNALRAKFTSDFRRAEACLSASLFAGVDTRCVRVAGDAPRNGSILERYWLLSAAAWYPPSLDGGPGLDEAVLAGALLRLSVIQQQ